MVLPELNFAVRRKDSGRNLLNKKSVVFSGSRFVYGKNLCSEFVSKCLKQNLHCSFCITFNTRCRRMEVCL